MALLSLQDVTVSFGGPPVLDHAMLRIDEGERIGLVGRNGAGKSTLMRLINGDIPLEQGDMARQQGLSVAMLTQEVPRDVPGTVFDEVARGVGPHAQLLADFHHVSVQYGIEHSESLHAELVRLERALESHGGWKLTQRVEQVLSRMDLPAEARCADLSAGMKRRVLLAKAIVREPDILLLDEPTNHLDITAIRWLEDFLFKYDKTVLFITHDRVFLRKLATRIIDVDRGQITSWACDYDTYLLRKEAALDAETKQQALFDKRLAQEEVWIRTGIKARRTRNEGRVRALEKLREVRKARRERPGELRMQLADAERSGRLVIETKNATFSYETQNRPGLAHFAAGTIAAMVGEQNVPVPLSADGSDISSPLPPTISDLSTLIMRGDKLGIVGPNGAGKTTLLRLLLGELTPQSGSVRHGTKLEIAYFDQLHAQLEDEKSIVENVTDGADRITIGGQSRHVIGYLEDFLFSPEQSRRPVKYLSGGERNRLLLARLFTKPSNVLVLDEPTNDLDMETLELLETLIAEYQGTVLIVSHDREFLNNVATSTLVLEGDGVVKEYPGGYDDYLRQRQANADAAAKSRRGLAHFAERAPSSDGREQNVPVPLSADGSQKGAKPTTTQAEKERARKLTYKEQKELAALPEKIAKLEAEQRQLHEKLADPGFYQQDRAVIAQTTTRLSALETELKKAYERWESLEQSR